MIESNQMNEQWTNLMDEFDGRISGTRHNDCNANIPKCVMRNLIIV